MLESNLSMKAPHLILASNSPRRRQLIELLGLPFVVCPANVDETQLPGEDPEAYVTRLALSKAKLAAKDQAGLVVASDTIVIDRTQVLGKPENENAAKEMLTSLQGRQHAVYSAVALIESDEHCVIVILCKTDVTMRQYTDEEMDAYIASGDPFDKAGGYAIQSLSFHPVEKIQGCYANVMGLPLCHILRTLRRLDIEVTENVPQRCQKTLNIQCPVYEDILSYNE